FPGSPRPEPAPSLASRPYPRSISALPRISSQPLPRPLVCLCGKSSSSTRHFSPITFATLKKMTIPSNSLTQPLLTPLAELERQDGATRGTWFGCSLPDHFGDWPAEYRLLRESVALLDKNYRAYLDFTGPDRLRYLNAILTNNIKDLRENH